MSDHRAILFAVARDRNYPDGPCWCGMAAGSPMVTEHSAACLAARAAVVDRKRTAAGGVETLAEMADRARGDWQGIETQARCADHATKGGSCPYCERDRIAADLWVAVSALEEISEDEERWSKEGLTCIAREALAHIGTTQSQGKADPAEAGESAPESPDRPIPGGGRLSAPVRRVTVGACGECDWLDGDWWTCRAPGSEVTFSDKHDGDDGKRHPDCPLPLEIVGE